MLIFIIVYNISSSRHLNTSHVNVNLSVDITELSNGAYLNTSHVNVNPFCS